MAKGFYKKILVAGRYEKAVIYSRVLPGDNKTVRQKKQAATTKAQQYINIKNCMERVELLLEANFDTKNSCFCTFTFSDDALPANQKHTQQIFSGFIRKLRPEFKRLGRPLRYIYTVEGDSSPSASPVDSQQWEIAPWRVKEQWEDLDNTEAQKAPETRTRHHVHCFLHLEKADYDTVRALWPYGHVYISTMKVNEISSFPRLAAYVTKEKRNEAKGNGVRAYIPSENLIQPTFKESGWCSEYDDLKLPMGAELMSEGSYNEPVYGASMKYLYYRFKRPQEPPKPYKRKGRLSTHTRKKATK